MSSSFVALILIVYGVYQYSLGGDINDLSFLAKSVGVSVFGVGYGLYNNMSTIRSYIPSFNALSKKEKNESEKCFSPKEFNLRDTEALYHLKQRCVAAKSKEGVETCAKLASIMFNLDLQEQVNETK